MGASVANIMPDHLVPFDVEKSKGYPTTRVPFFAHWLTLWCILFSVGYIQFAYELSGPIVDVLPTILAFTVLSIQLLPSLYGSRFISHSEWENPTSTSTSTLKKAISGSFDAQIVTDDELSKSKAGNYSSVSTLATAAASSNGEPTAPAAATVDDSADATLESGLVNTKSASDFASVPNSGAEDAEERSAEYSSSDGAIRKVVGHTENKLKDCFFGDAIPLSVSCTYRD
jgi:hypothetical protein